jgi:peptidyl-prolyl cis-trans isomerase C
MKFPKHPRRDSLRPSFQRWQAACLCGTVFACLPLLTVSCGRSAPSENSSAENHADPIALEIGERRIRLSELQSEADHLRAKRNPAAANPDSFLAAAIERFTALEKARELALDQDPELRRQWENLLIGRLRESEIEAKLGEVVVTDDEIRDHFEKNESSFSRPAQVHLALLYLPISPRAGEEDRAAVRQRMEEARALALELAEDERGFGSHAMTHSEEATSRFKGGDIGWLEAGATASRWPDEVVKAGFALKEKGDLSEVFEAGDGIYLLKKVDSREPAVRSLDGRLRSSLEAAILKQKRSTLEADLLESWRASTPVKRHEDVLKTLQFQPFEDSAGESDSIPTQP